MPAERPMTVTLLGTGTSTGVPVIGCTCRGCQSDDPRDRRTRTACYVRAGGLGLLIDAGPDFRCQALREGLDRLDAVLITHHHFDHIVGLDDLRPFFFGNRRAMPCFARDSTAVVLDRMFPYIFNETGYAAAPKLDLHVVDGAFDVATRYGDDVVPLRVQPVEAFHGEMPLFGFRLGRFAYLTDVSRIPEASYEQLAGLDVLVLDALRRDAHPTHFSFDEAVAAARRIGARQTYFVHMTHSVVHAEDDARLPDGINLGYDGLTFEVR